MRRSAASVASNCCCSVASSRVAVIGSPHLLTVRSVMSVPDRPPRHKPTLTGPGGPRVDTDRTVGNRGGAMTATNARRVGAPCDPALLDPAERMGVDELRALQLDRLRTTLRHVYDNVPHYRAAFDAAGVHPDDCRELADLARFPTTGKADLRDNYPFG